MDEGATLAVGGEVAGGGILEALDNGLAGRQQQGSKRPNSHEPKTATHRLSGTIVADDEGEGRVEGDGLLVLRPK